MQHLHYKVIHRVSALACMRLVNAAPRWMTLQYVAAKVESGSTNLAENPEPLLIPLH